MLMMMMMIGLPSIPLSPLATVLLARTRDDADVIHPVVVVLCSVHLPQPWYSFCGTTVQGSLNRRRRTSE
jgi:hypothetical protein